MNVPRPSSCPSPWTIIGLNYDCNMIAPNRPLSGDTFIFCCEFRTWTPGSAQWEMTGKWAIMCTCNDWHEVNCCEEIAIIINVFIGDYHQVLHLQTPVSHRTSSLGRALDEHLFLKSLTREEFSATELKLESVSNQSSDKCNAWRKVWTF